MQVLQAGTCKDLWGGILFSTHPTISSFSSLKIPITFTLTNLPLHTPHLSVFLACNLQGNLHHVVQFQLSLAHLHGGEVVTAFRSSPTYPCLSLAILFPSSILLTVPISPSFPNSFPFSYLPTN